MNKAYIVLKDNTELTYYPIVKVFTGENAQHRACEYADARTLAEADVNKYFVFISDNEHI